MAEAKKHIGRPYKEINKDEFKKLCGLHCTEQEIAGWFRCNVDTITDFCKREFNCSFSEAITMFGTEGKVSIRRMQFKLAEKSPAMAKWLGMQYLGQREQIDYTQSEVKPVRVILAGVDEQEQKESNSDRIERLKSEIKIANASDTSR